MATNEGKSNLFYQRELNSFETGLLLVRSARGGGLLGPAGLHVRFVVCLKKNGCSIGWWGGRPVRLQRGRSNDISMKKLFADGSQ